MKLIHLSDLHLGKKLNEFSLMEDQRYILSQIIDIAKTVEADGILIAGDIYDKSIPPIEAVTLFDDFLTRLADEHIPVFVVSGNHDSAQRLAYGSRLFDGRGIHISPAYSGQVEVITAEDAFGKVYIYLLPFVKPATVGHALGGNNPGDYNEAVALALRAVCREDNDRHILVAHQFVTGASRCDSEEIFVGGLDHVDAGVFEGFDYVALGHIHSPQDIKSETGRLRYCGSPLKYSFSEADQEKSVTVVEIMEKGKIDICLIPLKPLRDMKRLRGTYMELTDKRFYESIDREAYLEITLTDEDDVPDGLYKLRLIYPYLMKLSYDNARTKIHQEIQGALCTEEKSELALFEEFYELQNNQPMSAEQKQLAAAMIADLKE